MEGLMSGETITGIALVVVALLFMLAATMNEVWAIILPADYLILAIGFAFIALGVVSFLKNRKHSHEESTHHHQH
jgi:putative Ca2+/H+ antiporter (TMEM165/GDT1 family)